MISARTRQRVGSDGVLEQRPFVLVVHRSAALCETLLSTLDFDGFDVMTMADDDEAALIVKFIPPHAIVADRRVLSATQQELVTEARRASIPIVAFDDPEMMPAQKRVAPGIQPVRWDEGVVRLLEVLHELAAPPAHVLRRLA